MFGNCWPELQHLPELRLTSNRTEKQPCFPEHYPMFQSRQSIRRPGLLLFAAMFLAASLLTAQSDHTAMITAGGTWHLHKRIPLGSEALLVEPAHRPVQILATAEAPEFEGWQLESRHNNAVLLDVAGKPVTELPRVINFRVTVSARDKVLDSNPLPVKTTKDLNHFLLDIHFRLQVFRGMEMRELVPVATKVIGIPADELSDERIYRASFDVGSVRPDDRIVLLITDGAGNRISKFHLEFL